ncbi:hypothetical protein [Streptomyces griseorubiginosus]|uniref:hypothetical protein n=1 Tax=Streptomyces griseorubiginosus TaxID=67304 RepID=UPI001AD641A7|nr:hypothetical protein [Streptomyces griseorubiginosus]MBO4260094.1 hypothetical protein [Streptomyces griseorubiginosus]
MRTGRTWHDHTPAAFWRRRLRPYRTRRLLEAHALVLTLCAAVAVSALLVSCRQTQQATQALAARQAPAVQGLAATRLALMRADWGANDLVKRGLADIVGPGETYRVQLAAADQGLSRIADRIDQDLGTVNGLLASYSTSISPGAFQYGHQPLMRQQKLVEAASLLSRPQTGIAPRLDRLQVNQMGRAAATAGMGWVQRGGWWLAELSLAVLGVTLLSALFVVRDRCGRDFDVCLLPALALTVLLAVFPLLAASSAQHDLDRVGGGLSGITEVSRHTARCDPALSPAAWKKCGDHLTRVQTAVTNRSEQVRRELAGATWTDGVYRATLIVGLLVFVLPATGLGYRLDRDYWRQR